MDKKCAVILAAGEGTRMKSKKPKALAEVLFAPMIDWVIGAAKESGIDDICVVKGFGAEYLDAHLAGSCETVLQSERLGTGHAVLQAGKQRPLRGACCRCGFLRGRGYSHSANSDIVGCI